VDIIYRRNFGNEHGTEWFKEHGVIKWPKRVEEVYWKRFHHFGRVPLYFEHFKGIGEKVEKVKSALKLDDLDTKDYQSMPDWKPCPAYRDEEKSDELYAIYYKSVLHVFQYTIENPLLDQLTEKHSSYLLAINSSTAAKMKLKEKDMVEVKSEATGQSVQGMVHLTERVHPEVIGLLGTGGHWSKSLKIGSKTGKGVCAEWLIPIDLSTLDGVSGNQDLCSRVKIRKIEKASVSVPVIKTLA
jgi:molybdopterin-containing oxidoreductase family molybdopterin binding subunit